MDYAHRFAYDSPLLRANKTAALGWWCDLRDVDRDLCRADTNAEPIDDTADDEHGDVLRGRDDDAADDPGNGADPVTCQT